MQYIIVAVLDCFFVCLANVSSTDVKFRHDILLPKKVTPITIHCNNHTKKDTKSQSHALFAKSFIFGLNLGKTKLKWAKDILI